MKDLEIQLEIKTQGYRELNLKYEDLNGLVAGLRRDKERLEQEKIRLRSENESLANERDEFEKEHSEKYKFKNDLNDFYRTKIIDELNEVCQKMEKELNNQASKVSELRNKA